MSTRALGSAPRAPKLQRLIRRLRATRYHVDASIKWHPPVWVGKPRARFNGAKPANDLLRYVPRRRGLFGKLTRKRT